jgi:alanine racemase
MSFPTWVEIDLDRLERNLAALRACAGPDVAVLHVVKADGYGHGAVEVGRVTLQAGCALLGVATLHEGIELRQAGVSAPVLILSPSLPEESDEILAWRLTPTLSTLEQAGRMAEAARRAGLRAPVHVEVDTGMGRTGFDSAAALSALRAIVAEPALELEGVFTHFPDSDGEDLAFTRRQVALFDELLARLDAEGIPVRWRHAANSGAVLGLPSSHFNMIRPGIALLGVYPSPHVSRTVKLEPVLSFHARLVQVREVPAGHHISYGGTFVTTRPSRIGVVTAGYGHGLPRLLSNRGQVSVRGRRAPIVGRVTMDLTMVDLTDLPEALVGDEVRLFGGDVEGAVDPPIRVEEVAEWAETIPWEIFCQLDKRVVRKYVRGGRAVKVLTLVGERLESLEADGRGVLYSAGQRSVRASSSGGWRK